jgi:PAS domain S-box-containing protein
MVHSEWFNLSIAICAVLMGILLILLGRRKRLGNSSTWAFAICLILGAVAWGILARLGDSAAAITLKIVTGFMVGYLPVLIFTYILEYTSLRQRLSYLTMLLLAILPILLLLVLVARPVPGLLVSALGSQEAGMITPVEVWGWLLLVYSTGLLAASLTLLFTASGFYLKPFKGLALIAMLSALLAALVLDIANFTAPAPLVTAFPITLLGLILVGGAILYANLKLSGMDLGQIHRGEILDSFEDGMIVVNDKDQIVDMNPAAEQLVGVTVRQAYGRPIQKLLSNWNNVSDLNDVKETEFKGSIYLNQQWRYLNVRLNRLKENRGKIITLRDITDRKGIREARQLAREEMFLLLQSFFRIANSALTPRDFFRDVLFQIAYTFRVDSGAICMLETIAETNTPRFTLMASHGAFSEEEETLKKLHQVLDASAWMLENAKPLIIPDTAANPLLAGLFPPDGQLSLAVFPFLSNDQLLGVLMLARPQETSFRSDEIVRLTIITEELASFLFYDRKKKSDIAMAERHRLVIDLHDSITQKLHGLVKLTEAFQVGMESGAPMDKTDIMARISGNARQALREMRLFLHELQPIDIKKEGLVSALHQRLESVEGRSDIQARLITEGEILLPEEKEVEIYYIVEEALNNIIKHAHAKTVLIKMKQKKNAVNLEVIDNGHGFDPQNIETGGIGLKNMQERARRIDGKLKITSSPENGTKISLRIPQ